MAAVSSVGRCWPTHILESRLDASASSNVVATSRLSNGSTEAVVCMGRRSKRVAASGSCLRAAPRQLMGSSQQVKQRRPCMTHGRVGGAKAIGTRASCNDHIHCKSLEDSVKAIMKDVLQHCLKQENDAMRNKVLDQMAKGLAALSRVTTVVVAAESKAPFFLGPMNALSKIEDEDLHNVRKLLQLTSLPFGSSSDEDFKRLMTVLQDGDGQGRQKSPLTWNELSLIFDRLGSDLLQCTMPLAMCFPELPLWAKHRALLLPPELAERFAFSLISRQAFR